MIDEAWYPCVFEITETPGKMKMGGPLFNNVDGSPFQMMFRLPLPTRKGNMRLFVKGVNVGVIKADPANCVSQISVNGMTFEAMNVLFESTEHANMKQLKTYPFAPRIVVLSIQ